MSRMELTALPRRLLPRGHLRLSGGRFIVHATDALLQRFGLWDVARQRLDGLRDEVPLQRGGLLALAPESEPGELLLFAAFGVGVVVGGPARAGHACVQMRHERRRAGHGREGRDLHAGDVRGQSALGVLPPRRERPPGFRGFAEDEAGEGVHAADGEEEECGDERESVNMVRENSSADASPLCQNSNFLRERCNTYSI